MSRRPSRWAATLATGGLVAWLGLPPGAAVAESTPGSESGLTLPDLFVRIRPAVVAVGTLQPLRMPNFEFRGTGFAVGDGLTVVTNAHVVPASFDAERRESLGIAIPAGDGARLRPARVLRLDRDRDLALLRIDGAQLPALALADAAFAREGSDVALVGFPLGAGIGLYPAVHRGTVAAVTPQAIPTQRSQQLDGRAVQQLRAGPVRLYQLDATAFPGNSGSPLVDARSGEVIGVVNQVVVRTAKEGILPGPSGITYAVPVRYLHELLASDR